MVHTIKGDNLAKVIGIDDDPQSKIHIPKQ